VAASAPKTTGRMKRVESRELRRLRRPQNVILNRTTRGNTQ
jgi:hypothetical protein